MGDLYHMKVLRECLNQNCNTLVHVVSNRAIPDDCSTILSNSGTLCKFTYLCKLT